MDIHVLKKNLYGLKDNKGLSLVEVLISILLIGIVSVALAGGLSTSYKVLARTDARETAKNLAESEMEYVKGLPYETVPATYEEDPYLDIPAGFTVTITAEAVTGRDYNIQKITITVTGRGVTFELQGYKVNPAILG